MAELNGVQLLVSLLSSLSAGCQKQAARAIASVTSSNSKAREKLVELGGAQLLSSLFTSSNAGRQQRAAAAVYSLCSCSSKATEQVVELLECSCL